MHSGDRRAMQIGTWRAIFETSLVAPDPDAQPLGFASQSSDGAEVSWFLHARNAAQGADAPRDRRTNTARDPCFFSRQRRQAADDSPVGRDRRNDRRSRRVRRCAARSCERVGGSCARGNDANSPALLTRRVRIRRSRRSQVAPNSFPVQAGAVETVTPRRGAAYDPRHLAAAWALQLVHIATDCAGPSGPAPDELARGPRFRPSPSTGRLARAWPRRSWPP